MALTFQIENYDGSTTRNILSGLRVVEGSIREFEAADGRFTLTCQLINKDSRGNIIQNVTDLEASLRDGVIWHRDKYRKESWWLRWFGDSEVSKRALLYSYSLKAASTRTMEPHITNGAGIFDFAATYEPSFEGTTPVTDSNAGMSALGGTWSLAAYTGSRDDWRIAKMAVQPNNGMSKMWLGIRPNRYTNPYTPVLEIEDGSTGPDTTETTGDSAASNSARLDTTFAGDESLVRRTSLAAITDANFTSYIGRFTVLYRYLITDADTKIVARLSTSLGNPDTKAVSESLLATQYLEGESGTPFRIAPLGDISIPPGAARYGLIDNYTLPLWLNLYLGRLEGTGSVRSDCYILIPSEHQWRLADSTLPNDEKAAVFTYEDGRHEMYGIDDVAGETTREIQGSVDNWVLPKEGGYVVVAAEHSSGHDIAHTVDIDFEVIKRWRLYAKI